MFRESHGRIGESAVQAVHFRRPATMGADLSIAPIAQGRACRRMADQRTQGGFRSEKQQRSSFWHAMSSRTSVSHRRTAPPPRHGTPGDADGTTQCGARPLCYEEAVCRTTPRRVERARRAAFVLSHSWQTMTHELPGLGLDGRNVDLVQCVRSYLRHCRSKVLSGTRT